MSFQIRNIQPHPQFSSMTSTAIKDARSQPSPPPITSIENENVQPQPAGSPKAVDPALWPFEPFPAPPPDGYWLPKYAPPPPPKIRSVLDEIPPPPIRTFEPPLMALTYPPPPPLDERDPNWLFQMLADVQRQRAFLVDSLEEVHAEAANAYAEVGLAEAELEEEMAAMQEFINMVASVAGNGFVRRMLEDVNGTVERMSKGLHIDEEIEVVEEDRDDNSGYEPSVSSSFDTFESMQPTRGPVHD